MSRPAYITITDVLPRDGLQGLAPLPAPTRAKLIADLVQCGAVSVEAGAFVRPDRVPAMAHTEQVLDLTRDLPVALWALVANDKGLERAACAGIRNLTLAAAASDGFARANLGQGLEDSLTAFGPLIRSARARGMVVRVTLSAVLDCPYDGPVPLGQAARLAGRLYDMGADLLVLADTLGTATPDRLARLIGASLDHVPKGVLGLHLHDTYGQALANALTGLDLGIEHFDAAAGGLGGCPFAPGAGGNLATEDLVFLAQGLNIQTGMDLPRLARVTHRFCHAHGLDYRSKCGSALIVRERTSRYDHMKQ